MKKGIHPKWYPQARVTCACGNTFTVGSTKEEIKIEICSACHPFLPGSRNLLTLSVEWKDFKKNKKQPPPRFSVKEKGNFKRKSKKPKKKKYDQRHLKKCSPNKNKQITQ